MMNQQPLPSISSVLSESSSVDNCHFGQSYQNRSFVNLYPPVYFNQWPEYTYTYPVELQQPLQNVHSPNNYTLNYFESNEKEVEKEVVKTSRKRGKISQVSTKGARKPRPDGICSHCSTQTTTLWRKSEDGLLECNACNLYERRNGVKRPLHLVKEKLTRRNRRHVKHSSPITSSSSCSSSSSS